MAKIEHVVVLMLENRSFDSMLGRLYPKSDRFDGLDGSESNPWHKPDGTVERIPVWNSAEITPADACIPDPDPGELFTDMHTQLFGLNGSPDGPVTMDGFVDNYMKQPPVDRPYDPRAVMHHIMPDQIPVMTQLARAFAVSDRWHASAPCETWPNRYFAHCGTGGGWVNNERSRFPHHWPRTMPTIFRRLDRAGYDWKVYFHDVPQAVTLFDLWLKMPTHFCFFESEFARHVRTNRLPHYSFIEPRYYANLLTRKLPNDQHPPHNMLYGEQLIASVYNALRQGPAWERTLLVITYDEHGGCYDHVPPPAATAPGGPCPDGFSFDRYGVRVPALIISPWVAPGGVIRPPVRDDGRPPAPFDHASIPATLHRLFDIGPPLTPRVAAAPDLLCALTLPSPDNMGPARVETDPHRPHRAEIRAHRRRPRNRHQAHLTSAASLLPGAITGITAGVRSLGAKLVPERLRQRRNGPYMTT
jgi:phospholipase C